MARRSSARIRNRNSSTPKRVSLSHDAPLRTPRTAPVKLQALREYDEMPGAFPGSSSPPGQPVNKSTATLAVNFNDSTPPHATPIKPAAEEMHPQHHQQSTAKAGDEARWLGFTNMVPNTEPPKPTSRIAVLQGTPTKAPKPSKDAGSPKFKFSFGREQSLELSLEAKKLMSEKREEALRIREQMIADGEALKEAADLKGRKIATPKGKKGRFSEVHLEQFKKLDSIAGHASSFRADPNRPKFTITPTKPRTDTQTSALTTHELPKSLKRSPSKAGLTEPDRNAASARQSESTPPLAQHVRTLPQSFSSRSLQHQDSPQSSPTKRVKMADTDDVSTERFANDDCGHKQPTTPLQHRNSIKQSMVESSTVNSPTQASLARKSSIKSIRSTRIPGPALPSPSSKMLQKEQPTAAPKASTPLLARSPSKASLFSNPKAEQSKGMMSPLLMRSPSKPSHAHAKSMAEDESKDEPKSEKAPLLSRTPLKMSVSQVKDMKEVEEQHSSSTPLLARSPVKLPVSKEEPAQSDHKSGTSLGSGLMGRFNLLRSSPMKSILRSPQRLYSNDPAKVAAGTHLASPATGRGDKQKALSPSRTSTEPVGKRVDFTSSTKARYERAQSEADSTPSKGPTPPPKPDAEPRSSPKAAFAGDYPTLPTDEAVATVTPQKRRQTAVPGDFTFTSHGNGIIFAQSPNAPVSAAKSNRPSTIRHVSAEPQIPPAAAPATGSKKRKFDFENDEIVGADGAAAMSDKENSEADRPAKRVKPSSEEPPATKPVTKRPTLGVKPKKSANGSQAKKPTTISRARLNALAQPKRKA